MAITTDRLFTQARTATFFLESPGVDDDTLHALYELLKWGPTASNCCPARFVFVRTPQAKERLLGCLSPGNVAKAKSAPVTAVIGMDMAFYDQLPVLYPQADARSWFAGQPEVIAREALRSSSLQAAYLIIAARTLGLDAAPMGGIDAAKMDAEFFAGTTVKSHMVCCLGHADVARQRPRNPRLPFDQACRLA
ncbi:MAG: malonic semialdehyde reductase [Burkholderiales bacterium]|jgi:3-hydroxypropanoate dehydrogenase